MTITTFSDVAPCSLVEIDQRFRGSYCIHHRGGERRSISARLHGAISHKAVIFAFKN
jgi:hypothetical protein